MIGEVQRAWAAAGGLAIHSGNARSRAVAERIRLTLEPELPHPSQPVALAVYARERPSAARPA
jgi:hypothetical protein